MSDLQPEGSKLTFNGEERSLLWDYGVIEKAQEKYGGHPIMAIEAMFWTNEDGLNYYQAGPVLDLAELLLNNEVDREKYFDGKSSLKTYTRKELGHLITRDNANDIVQAIVASWTGSMPMHDDDEDDEKNVKTGKRSK